MLDKYILLTTQLYSPYFQLYTAQFERMHGIIRAVVLTEFQI